VWLHLRKRRLPSSKKNKLMARGGGLHKVVKKVGENAYKIQLLGDTQISTIFNVRDLTPYLKYDEEHDEDLRKNHLQRGGLDAELPRSLGLLSLARVMNQVGLILTLGQGLGPPRSILTWGP